MKKPCRLIKNILVPAAFMVCKAQATMTVYMSAPGVQSAETSGFVPASPSTLPFTGFQTESFNTWTQGTLTNGGSYLTNLDGASYVVTGTVGVSANNQYGGYGLGNYLTVNGAGSKMTITFNNLVNYFGFLWTAGDSTNRISFYGEHGNRLGTYSTADLMAMLPKSPAEILVATNGDEYSSDQFYGKPPVSTPVNDRQNNNEPYAYLHFMDSSNASNIKTIVVEKDTSGGGTGNFESDNHTIALYAPIIDDDTSIIEMGVIPEPSRIVCLAAGGILLGFRRRKELIV